MIPSVSPAERKKKLAIRIVRDLTELIVMSHCAVQEKNAAQHAKMKDDMAELGLKITHDLYEAIQ